MRVLVTRPEPAAHATAAALAALGHDIILVPLLATVSRRWHPPATPPQALLITSANVIAHGGTALAQYHPLPTFAVGAATAAALHAAGFTDVRTSGPDVVATLAAAHAQGITALLHLAGANRTAATPPAGLSVAVCTVYQARPALQLPETAVTAFAAGQIDVVLLYSARTAQTFATLTDRAGVPRATLHIAALSPKAAASAGTGWARVAIAATPTQAGLFAAAGLVCDKGHKSAAPAAKGR